MPNLVNPEFKSVINSDAPANVETDYVDFVGTYSPVSIYTAGKTNLYLGADNTLYYPNSAKTIGAFRAYFQLKGLTVGDIQRGVKMYFGDEEDDADGISLTPDSSPEGEGSDAWYSLDGKKLSGKPSQKGIYVNNGRKVVIK
jgi:hypothetical protein